MHRPGPGRHPGRPARWAPPVAAACLAAAFALPAFPALAGAQQSIVPPAMTASASQVVDSQKKPFAALSHSAQRLRDSLVVLARAQVGRPYRLGGTSPTSGFDCSGLVKYVMAALAVDLPRTAAQQARNGRAIARDTVQLRPGDLLTFGRGKRVDHVGIYIGNGRFIHASSVAGRVIESPVVRPKAPLIKPWKGVRRVLTAADSTPDAAPLQASSPAAGSR